MSGLAQYFAMGGYAVFIWPSYGLGLILLAGMVIAAYRRMRLAETAIEEVEAASPQIGRAERGS
jgi:heme exporter protein D